MTTLNFISDPDPDHLVLSVIAFGILPHSPTPAAPVASVCSGCTRHVTIGLFELMMHVMRTYIIAAAAFATLMTWYLVDGRWTMTSHSYDYTQWTDRLTGAQLTCTKQGKCY